MGCRKCGAFLSTLVRFPHPICTRCRGECAPLIGHDICAYWSATQWELFLEKRSSLVKEAFSPFRLCSTCAVGFSPRGNSFGSFAFWDFCLFSFPPFRWSGEEGGSRDAPGIVSRRASSPPAGSQSSERGGSASGLTSVACELVLTSLAPSGAGEGGVARSQRS